MKSTPTFAPAGQTTQMVVGATASPDATILVTSESLYKKFSLRRVYYSAYSPIPGADAMLPAEKPSLVRENRLYQADWLLRFYGFHAQELVTEQQPNLPLDLDPKTHWALMNRAFFPVNVNTADREALLRVPGLGVRNVDRILQLRRFHPVKLADLAKMNVALKRAKYFVITTDHNPDVWLLDQEHLDARLRPPATQLSLFDQARGEI